MMDGHSLPRQSTPLIGREKELIEVQERLRDPACRLLTVVGPGGVGKTRLALEAASQAAGEYSDGVYFVDLQPMSGADLATALAEALPLTLSGSEEPEAQLVRYLQGKQALLLLDNFEHLLGQAEFLSEMLSHSPALQLFVTSREALNLQNEWLYPLRGLGVPPDPPEKELSEYSAVQLFADHARRLNPAFSVDEEGKAAARICRLVEGLPLALKLAASWTRTLDTAEIADEIQRNLEFLARPLRDIPERHRSIQAAFNQTWNLLDEDDRRVFRQLSIFKGGFHRQAARSVAGADVETLSTLVDKSMLRREERYRIHELLRQFGEEKLAESPQEAAAVRRRFIDYYAEFLHRQLDAITGSSQQQASAQIAGEWENIRAAWEQAAVEGNRDAIHKAATTYFLFCQLRSRFLEGADALKAASTRIEGLVASRERALTLAQLFNHEGWLRIRVGEFQRARQLLTASRSLIEEYGAVPPPYMGSDPAVPLAITHNIQGEPRRAVELCESALAAAKDRDDLHNQAFAHYGLAAALISRGQYQSAYDHARQACQAARETGNRWFLAYPLIEWGNAARAMGKFDEAQEYYQESYAIRDEFDDPEGMAVALSRLGEMAIQGRRYREARNNLRRSLNLYRDLNDRGGLATSLHGLGQVAQVTGDIPTASRYFWQALEIATGIDFRPLALSIIMDLAALFSSQDDNGLALSLLGLARDHPASRHETRQRARGQLQDHQPRMDEDDFKAAVQQGADWTLDQARSRIEAKLADLFGDEREPGKGSQPLVEPLTDREQDVLRLIAQGYTNEDISQELVLAVGTVKWYASQIYGKLGVSNRTEAAVRARKLDLVS